MKKDFETIEHTCPEAVQEFANSIIPNEEHEKKFHAVMMFFHQGSDLGIPKELWKEENPTGYICTRTLYFDNVMDALNCYANTRCSASQHISASTKEELKQMEKEMIENFKSEAWLEENIYPYM